MPKVTIVQTNFTAGELTPKLGGRVDISRYANGAKIVENAWPVVQGGAERRWGTVFEGETKISDKRSRLIPFVFSRDQSYILEFGDLYLRVFKPEGQVLAGGGPAVFEIATPFTQEMLGEIDFTQGADTMFLWHSLVYPQRLRRLADDAWVMDSAPFETVPFAEYGWRPSATLTVSDPSVGVGRTFTASVSGIFYDSDVGREVVAGSGVGVITAVPASNQLTVTINTVFDTTSYVVNTWKLTGSPRGEITPSVDGPVGAGVNLASSVVVVPVYGPINPIAGLAWNPAGTGYVEVTVPSHGYSVGDVVEITGCTPVEYNGTYTIDTAPDASTFTYVKGTDPGIASALGLVRKVTSSSTQANIWRLEDEGCFVRINSGLVRLTDFISPISMNGIIEQALTTAVTAPADAWSLERPVWNAVDGYPRTGTFFQQRLFAAGSPGYPQTIWGSVIGLYFSFLLGVNDDDGFSFDLASDNVNPILFLAAMEALVCLTYGGEFTIEGGVEKPITPTNIRVKPRGNLGCGQVRPLRVGNEELFVQRTRKVLRAIGYNEDLGSWAAPDMSVLSEHLVRQGITTTTWQDDPGKLVFVVRDDGQMATATYDRDQDVVGWARQITDGDFESVSTIPAGEQDQTWAVVRRTINGVTKRYVERLAPDVLSDCSIVGTHPTGAATWTGLSHLEGKTVHVIADGCFMPPQLVSGGQITLPRDAMAVTIGLPYTSRIKLLPPEVTGQLGSAQAAAMDVGEVYLRVNDTIGGKVNGQVVTWRRFGAAVLDKPPEPYTGLKKVENLGWAEGESEVEITQDQPFPWQILSVIRKWSSN